MAARISTLGPGFNPHGLVVADGAVWIALAHELI
jgi:hypothetical protein